MWTTLIFENMLLIHAHNHIFTHRSLASFCISCNRFLYRNLKVFYFYFYLLACICSIFLYHIPNPFHRTVSQICVIYHHMFALFQV